MHILILSYYFPPMGGVGVQRALKFVKYLPQFGITTTVIAAEDANYTSDPKLLDQLPQDCEVVRLHHTPLLTRFTSSLRVRGHLKKSSGQEAQTTKPTLTHNTKWRDNILRYYNSLQFPDDKVAWGKKAFESAVRIHASKPFDLILSTSPPVTSHFVGARLKQQLGIPWFSDFRDLWTENEFYNLPLWRKWLDKFTERKLLAQVDGVVTVTDGFAKTLRQIVPTAIPVEVIYNGYDEEDFASFLPLDKGTERFLLLYAGTLYGRRSPLPFLKGLHYLLEREPVIGERLCVRFVGNIGSRFEPMLIDFERRYPGVIERRPFVAHSQIPALLASADALLMILGGDNAGAVLPAKIFEYLKMKRPILFIGPADCESSLLIRRTGHGISCEEHSPEQIADGLKSILEGSFHLGIDDGVIEQFERSRLTGRLAEFLHNVSGIK